MESENLAYALTQVVHNLGAVTVAGGPFLVLWPRWRLDHARVVAWAILAGWGAQIASGIGFGATSLYYYGDLPDLSAIATYALAIKVTAALTGLVLAALYLWRGREWHNHTARRAFVGLAGLGIIALTAAAFLRWFS